MIQSQWMTVTTAIVTEELKIFLFLLINYTWMLLPDLYIHRGIVHRQVIFSTALTNVVKLICWSRTTKYRESDIKYWAATHLKHHAYPDTIDDPQSPHFYSTKFLIKYGRDRISDEDTEKFTKNYISQRTTLDDFLEKYSYGPSVLLLCCFFIFSWWGLAVWVSLMLTNYYSSIANILFHKLSGYRNAESLRSSDRSRNIFPVGILMGGEELHGNHHRWPERANFAVRKWEFDIGYWALKVFEIFKLVRIVSNNNNIIKNLKATRYS
jgi:stearoyl-CoA desaturase (delta-9 desaturase)